MAITITMKANCLVIEGYLCSQMLMVCVRGREREREKGFCRKGNIVRKGNVKTMTVFLFGKTKLRENLD